MTAPVSPASDAEFQQLVDKTRNAHDRASKKVDEGVAKLRGIVDSVPDILLPDWARGYVMDAIAKIYDLFHRLTRELQKFFNSPGWPWALWNAGNVWVNNVAKPCADTEARVNETHMHVDDYWKGSAAQSYKGTLPKQQAAFAAMTQVARKLGQACDNGAFSIVSLWAGLALAVLGLVAAAIGFGLSMTGIGAIGGIPTFIIGIIGVIGGIGAVAWTAIQGFHGISETVSSLKQEVALNTSFNDDQWPTATAQGTWKAD